MGSKRLDVSEVVTLKAPDGEELEFSVVALLEDEEDGTSYAVLLHEGGDEEEDSFIVTDPYGELLEDDALAQEVLDDYLLFAEQAPEDGEA